MVATSWDPLGLGFWRVWDLGGYEGLWYGFVKLFFATASFEVPIRILVVFRAIFGFKTQTNP